MEQRLVAVHEGVYLCVRLSAPAADVRLHLVWVQDMDDLEDEGASARSLVGRQLEARCTDLRSSITSTVFNYIRRGLFDTHKLLVAALLCFKILTTEGRLHPDAFSTCRTLVAA